MKKIMSYNFKINNKSIEDISGINHAYTSSSISFSLLFDIDCNSDCIMISILSKYSSKYVCNISALSLHILSN